MSKIAIEKLNMIKLIQYLVFLVLFSTCTSKVNDTALEVLKDGISEIKQSNQNSILRLERNLSEQSFESKLANVDSAKSLIYMRDAALRNKITLNVYGEHLFEKYKTCEIADSNRLARAKTLLSIDNHKTDSIHYYQSLLSLLMIERDLIEVCMMNGGAADSKCLGFHIPMYSDPDTIKVNTSFAFIACGFEKLRGSSVLKIHDKFNVTFNGVKLIIPIDYKIIGNAVVVTVTPNKLGMYVVTGGMGIFDQNLNYQASDTFRKSFYVID